MANKDKGNIRLPWLSAQNPELASIVRSLASELSTRSKKASGELTRKQASALVQEFKHSEQGRSPVYKFIIAVAKRMKIEDPDGAVVMAPMKDWDRAVDKYHAPGRKLHDLGRGRIYVRTAEEVQNFYKLLAGKTSEGYVRGVPQTAFIIPGTLDDYLKNPRSSGFAGSINFDLGVDLRKARSSSLEVQIMPIEYKEAEKRSHCLFNMIRILQEIPEHFRTPVHDYVTEGLVIANKALFDEQALRTGFDQLRDKPIERISEEDFRHSYDVLDRVRTEIERIPGRRYAWMTETMDAISYAKTSVANLYAASDLDSKQTKKRRKKYSEGGDSHYAANHDELLKEL